jgi:hypothetical protein
MRIGRYGELLRRYYDAFPREQIHVYLFDDLKRDPLGVIREIYRFLGIDPGFAPDLETPHNVGGIPGNMGLERFLTSHRLRALVEPFVPRRLADRIRKLRTRNLRPAPALPEDLRRELVEPFRDDIRAASALIDRDLDRWLEPPGEASVRSSRGRSPSP